jgi:MscS family membrane protein
MHFLRAPPAALLVLTAVLLAAGGPALADDPVQIIDVDAAPRSVAPGGEVSFEWTVRNLDTIAYNVTVSVEPKPGWKASVDPAVVAGLAPNRAATVRLQVQAPSEAFAEVTASFLVRFSVADGGAVVLVAARTANVTIPSALTEKRVLGVIANPLASPLDNEYGVFLLDVVVWLGIAVALRFLIDPVLKTFTSRTKTQVDDIILRVVKTPLAVLLFLYGALNSLSALDAHLPAWMINGALVAYAFGSSLIFFYLGYRVFRDVFMHVARGVAKRTSSNIDDLFLPIVEKVGLVVLGLAALGLLLGFLNVDLTLFVAGGVVTSMVVAFAAQDTLSNFFSGLFLLTDRPFREGDTVILSDGDWVEVRRIGMRTTRMFRFTDAAMITIPNNKLVNEKIANFTNPRDQGRVMMKFSAGYGSDAAQVKALIADVINRCPNIVKQDPFKPIVRFDAMADSSLVFFVLVWVDHRDSRFDVQDFLNSEVYKAFGAAGVEIPFPQRTVHLMVDAPAGGPLRAAAGKAAEKADGSHTRKAKEPALASSAPPPAARTGEAEHAPAARAAKLSETVGELFDQVVGGATTVPVGAPLVEAVQALLTVPVTRKVYVVDASGRPVGTLTLEDVMRGVAARLEGGQAGTGAFVRELRELRGGAVETVARKPTPVTRDTKLVDIALMIVKEKLNDFPVVDDAGRIFGELNSQRLLDAVLPLLDDAPPPPAEGTPTT